MSAGIPESAAECAFPNGGAVALESVPALPLSALTAAATEARDRQKGLIALLPLDDGAEGRLLLVLSDPSTGHLSASSFRLNWANSADPPT